MNVFWKGIAAVTLLLYALPAFSQILGDNEETSKFGYSRYFVFGAGATYRSFIDQLLSSRKYEKVGPTAAIANIRLNENKYTELWIQGSYVNAETPNGPFAPARVKMYNGLIDYRHLYKIDFLNEMIYDVRVGGLLSAQYAHKNAPHLEYSGKVDDYAMSIGLSGKIAREIMFDDLPGYIMLDVSMPLLSSSSRPPYLNKVTALETEKNSDNGFFANNSIGLFGKFLRLNTRIHFLYPLKRTTNKLRFTYQWDYFKIKGASAVYSAEHTLMLTFMFNY